MFSCCWGVLGRKRAEIAELVTRFLVSGTADKVELLSCSGLTAGCWGALESFGISSSFANLFFGRIANAAREPPAFTPSVPAVAVVRNTQSQ